MVSQKHSKQLRMGSWLLRLQSIDMKTKMKNKGQQTIIKNNRKIKEMENITSTMDYCPRNGYMGDTDP